MDLQTIFNTAVFGVMTQNIQSRNKGGCMLRGEQGAKCAVGWLLPDELYDPVMEPDSELTQHSDENGEEDGAAFFFEATSLGKALLPLISVDETTAFLLMSALQEAHDSDRGEPSTFRLRMNTAFRKVAHDFSLDPGVLDVFTGA
jgi:hypothetical protein